MTGPRRVALAVAVALPVLLVTAVVVAALVLRARSEPLALGPVPAPAAASPECADVIGALPGELDGGDAGGLPGRGLAEPAPPGTAAWGDEPVVLRCGVERPVELTATSYLVVVGGVQFLQLTGPGARTWVAVDRQVYLALTLPDALGTGPVQQVADTIRATLPAQAVDASP